MDEIADLYITSEQFVAIMRGLARPAISHPFPTLWGGGKGPDMIPRPGQGREEHWLVASA